MWVSACAQRVTPENQLLNRCLVSYDLSKHNTSLWEEEVGGGRGGGEVEE